MPIYEYQCEACGSFCSRLIIKPEEEHTISCGKCRSRLLKRIPSGFALHKTEAQRVKDFNPRDMRGDGFYKDDRNVGLWAKSRLNSLGVDLGPQYEEKVEQARTGKFLDSEII